MVNTLSKFILASSMIFSLSANGLFYNDLITVKAEGGFSLNNLIKLEDDSLDTDADGTASQFRISDSNDASYYAGVGLTSKLKWFDPFIFELIYGFNSDVDVNIKEVVAENATGPISGTSSLTRHTGLFNAYYMITKFDLTNGFNVMPFVQGGIGFAINDLDDLKLYNTSGYLGKLQGDSNTEFAWSVGAGFRVENFSLGYRYVESNRAKTTYKLHLNIANPANAALGNLIEGDRLNFRTNAHLFYVGLTI